MFVCSLFCFAVLCVLSSFCTHLDGEERAGWVTFASLCQVTVMVLWLFLVMPSVGRQCVIVVFSDHTHFFLVNEYHRCNSLVGLCISSYKVNDVTKRVIRDNNDNR